MSDLGTDIGGIDFYQPDPETLLVSLSGVWKIGSELPSTDEVRKRLESASVQRVAFDTSELVEWDSLLLTFLLKIQSYTAQEQIQFEEDGLPKGARGLLALALAVPERKGARRGSKKDPFLSRVGESALLFFHSTGEMVDFIGEAFSAFLKLLRGRARFRPSDLVLFIQDCGADALPIVSLISLLVGLILAFVAAIQLKMFGAQIFVADVVGIAMVRVMGAVMTVGSPLVIRGVKIGSVTDVELQYNPRDLSIRIRVSAEFDPDKIMRVSGMRYAPRERLAVLKRLIDNGLRGQLQMQSIVTGQLMINLDFLPNTPVRLVGANPHELEIPTVPTTIEELAKRIEKIPVEEIFEKLASSVKGVNNLVSSPEVQGGAKGLAQSIEELRGLIRSINDEIKPLSASLRDTLKDTRSLFKDADKMVQGVDRQVSQVEGTLVATRKLVGDVNKEVTPMTSDLRKTLEEARAALVQTQKTLEAAESHYSEGSAFYYELTETLEGLNEASRSIALLGDYLRRHPESVLWGKTKRGGK
jgi:ABC-type transporter Mla subunit MlaD